jgi:GntR family phosphonate transport system transcriptional regulator
MDQASNGRPALRRGAGVAVWRQIETDIEVDIQTGLFGPGDRLPSEHELVGLYGVNRHTVRMALAKLAERGIVTAHKGRGVFVAGEPFEYRLDRNAKWSEVEKRFDARPSGRLVDSYRRPSTARLSRMLGLGAGAELLVTESVRTAGADLATYGYHMFDAVRFAGIERSFAECGSFTHALSRHGISEFFRASTWIDCRMPRPREAAALGIPVEAPVLVMAYVDCDAARKPILLGHAIIPQGRLRFRIDSDFDAS